MPNAQLKDWLATVIETARHRRSVDGCPPFSWYRWMKLEEAADQLLEAEKSYIFLAVRDGNEVVPDTIKVNLP